VGCRLFQWIEAILPTLTCTETLYGLNCIDRADLVRYLTSMPAYTEARIQQLCTEVLSVKTQAEVDRVIPELRAALEEHISLAKESLELQARTLAALNGLAGNNAA